MAQPPVFTIDISDNQATAIDVKNVYKSYGIGRRKADILKDVYLNVSVGSIYGLLGPSGCGKTTLLRCVIGNLRADSGKILVFGKKPGTPESKIPGSIVGYMPQELALYDKLTIGEILKYFGKLHHMTPSNIVQRISFLLTLLKLPGERKQIGKLSGGQQRRVSFAIALLQEPPLLILDEPTVGVDPVLRQNIWDHLIQLTSAGKVTVVITTHYVEEAKQANRVGFMRNGRTLLEDEPNNLLLVHQSLEEVFVDLCSKDTNDELQSPVKKRISLKKGLSRKTKAVRVRNLSSKTEGNENKRNYLPSWSRISAIAFKNYLGMRRAKWIFLFEISNPVIQLLFFVMAFGKTPQNLSVAVVNSGASNGESFLRCIDNKTISQERVNDTSTATDMVLDKHSWGVVEIDEHFTDSLAQKFVNPKTITDEMLNSSVIHVRLDMTSSEIGATLQRTLFSAYEQFVKSNLKTFDFKEDLASSPVVIGEPIYGKTNAEFVDFAIPGFICSIAYFMALGLPAMSLIIEKKEGMLQRNYVAGVSHFEMMCGQVITQFSVVVIQVFFMMLLTFFAFDMQSGIIWISLLTLLQALAGMANGYVISATFSNQQSAMSTIIGSFYFNTILSGIIWPLEGLPTAISTFGKFLPMTLATESIRCIMNREMNITQSGVWIGFFTSFAWIIISTILAALITKITRRIE